MDEKRLVDFSKRFNEALDDAGCPPKGSGRQGWVAKRYKVSQKGARKWLESEGMPKLARCREIAEDLKLNLIWFMSGHGEKYLDQSFYDAMEKSYHMAEAQARHQYEQSFGDIPQTNYDYLNSSPAAQQLSDNIVKLSSLGKLDDSTCDAIGVLLGFGSGKMQGLMRKTSKKDEYK